MLFDITTSNAVVVIRLVDDDGDPLDSLAYDTSGLALHARLQDTVDWVQIPLVVYAGEHADGAFGPHVADDGLYLLGLPNWVLVPGETTDLRFTLPDDGYLYGAVFVTGTGSHVGGRNVANAIKHETLVRYVCQYAGFGQKSYDDLSGFQKSAVDDILDEAVRQVYFPEGELSHDWSFLQTRYSVPVVAGRIWYPLPGDFIRLSTALTVDGTLRVDAVSESEVTLRLANDSRIGPPAYAAIRPAGGAHNSYEIGFYPMPDMAYQVDFAYLADPGGIGTANPSPRGGAAHAATFVASAIAATERLLNPEQISEGSFQQANFARKLASSIEADKRILGGD